MQDPLVLLSPCKCRFCIALPPNVVSVERRHHSVPGISCGEEGLPAGVMEQRKSLMKKEMRNTMPETAPYPHPVGRFKGFVENRTPPVKMDIKHLSLDP